MGAGGQGWRRIYGIREARGTSLVKERVLQGRATYCVEIGDLRWLLLKLLCVGVRNDGTVGSETIEERPLADAKGETETASCCVTG
jgi:hypothetical protein